MDKRNKSPQLSREERLSNCAITGGPIFYFTILQLWPTNLFIIHGWRWATSCAWCSPNQNGCTDLGNVWLQQQPRCYFSIFIENTFFFFFFFLFFFYFFFMYYNDDISCNILFFPSLNIMGGGLEIIQVKCCWVIKWIINKIQVKLQFYSLNYVSWYNLVFKLLIVSIQYCI